MLIFFKCLFLFNYFDVLNIKIYLVCSVYDTLNKYIFSFLIIGRSRTSSTGIPSKSSEFLTTMSTKHDTVTEKLSACSVSKLRSQLWDFTARIQTSAVSITTRAISPCCHAVSPLTTGMLNFKIF